MTAKPSSPEVHIASVIVQVRPGRTEALTAYLERSPDLEVHADAPEGKQVIVLEGKNYKDLLAHIDAMRDLPGVLSCNLVYHEVMNEIEADQEMISTGRHAHNKEAKL